MSRNLLCVLMFMVGLAGVAGILSGSAAFGVFFSMLISSVLALMDRR